MAWPDETTADQLTTANGTPFRRARLYPNGVPDRATIHAPTAIAEGGPARLVIAFHGTDGFDSTMDGSFQVPTRDALLDAGYVIVSGQLGTNTWGNATGIERLVNLYAWCQSVWEVTDTLFYGQSQGGGVAMAATRLGVVPTLRAVALLAPAVNFQWVATQGGSSTAILDAYGATVDNFAQLSADRAPLAGTTADYAGLRVQAWASYADTTLDRDRMRPRRLLLLQMFRFRSLLVFDAKGGEI